MMRHVELSSRQPRREGEEQKAAAGQVSSSSSSSSSSSLRRESHLGNVESHMGKETSPSTIELLSPFSELHIFVN